MTRPQATRSYAPLATAGAVCVCAGPAAANPGTAAWTAIFVLVFGNLAIGLVEGGIAKAFGGADYDVAAFTPPYNPWDQRLCLVPDDDLFQAMRSGKPGPVTKHLQKAFLDIANGRADDTFGWLTHVR